MNLPAFSHTSDDRPRRYAETETISAPTAPDFDGQDDHENEEITFTGRLHTGAPDSETRDALRKVMAPRPPACSGPLVLLFIVIVLAICAAIGAGLVIHNLSL